MREKYLKKEDRGAMQEIIDIDNDNEFLQCQISLENDCNRYDRPKRVRPKHHVLHSTWRRIKGSCAMYTKPTC